MIKLNLKWGVNGRKNGEKGICTKVS